MRYDLHIHSCLSPCANREMTPATIAGLCALNGADVIAIADHNSALNLPAAEKCCKAYGVKLLPALEANTAEEIHLLCYFPTVRPRWPWATPFMKACRNSIGTRTSGARNG